MSYAPRPSSRSPSGRASNGSNIPPTPTVSRCPHSSSVRPPPLPGARTITLGRAGSPATVSTDSPASVAHADTNSAIARSPAPPSTSDGFTESMLTSEETSSGRSSMSAVMLR